MVTYIFAINKVTGAEDLLKIRVSGMHTSVFRSVALATYGALVPVDGQIDTRRYQVSTGEGAHPTYSK